MNVEPLVMYVDVDDTLIRTFGSKVIPNASVVSHVRALFHSGATMYCWSSAGAEYAKDIAVRLGIHDCFIGFLSKPNVIVDDMAVDNWRRCVHVLPIMLHGKSIKDYWRMIDERR